MAQLEAIRKDEVYSLSLRMMWSLSKPCGFHLTDDEISQTDA